ncbi:MAG TPA: phosphopantetheine-binding protein [Actinocrinis sp.]|jgi:hypothetical protein
MESWPRVHQLGGPDEVSETQPAPSGAPASLVQGISALWGEFLNDGDVKPDDDFFTLGGNSITGIKIIDRIAQDHGVDLSVRDFYLAQTPARVAELIDRQLTDRQKARTP